MKKIFKILSILVMVFVLFSCANSASDDSNSTSDDSNPTSEPSKHSIIFKHNLKSDWAGYMMFDEVTDFLNSLPEFKNLEEGTEVQLPWVLYANVNLEVESIDEISKTETDNSNYVFTPYLGYYVANIGVSTDASKRLRSVTIGNEDIVIQLFNCYGGPIEEYHQNSN